MNDFLTSPWFLVAAIIVGTGATVLAVLISNKHWIPRGVTPPALAATFARHMATAKNLVRNRAVGYVLALVAIVLAIIYAKGLVAPVHDLSHVPTVGEVFHWAWPNFVVVLIMWGALAVAFALLGYLGWFGAKAMATLQSVTGAIVAIVLIGGALVAFADWAGGGTRYAGCTAFNDGKQVCQFASERVTWVSMPQQAGWYPCFDRLPAPGDYTLWYLDPAGRAQVWHPGTPGAINTWGFQAAPGQERTITYWRDFSPACQTRSAYIVPSTHTRPLGAAFSLCAHSVTALRMANYSQQARD